ncbi:MAG: hypothetical protein U1E20_09595 [Methylocystis sp.]|uniref:hypothetical protein n=1 Tax=Methylocystis sp. TaxID=1911079 RepID=UPI0039638455
MIRRTKHVPQIRPTMAMVCSIIDALQYRGEGRVKPGNAKNRNNVSPATTAWEKRGRRLQGQNQLPKVVRGVTFRDGIEVAFEAKSAILFIPSPQNPE